MPSDRSTDKPGPMGYNIPGLSQVQLAYREAQMREQLMREVEEHPGFSIGRADEKPANVGLLRRIVELQMADDIEDGFSFLHLVRAINDNKPFNWLAQETGSCVASGDMRSTAMRNIAEVFLLNQAEQLPGIDIEGTDAMPFFAPWNYRMGRKIGNLNGGPGSFCASHIKGKMRGHLLCSTPGLEQYRLPEPSGRIYDQLGNSNSFLDKYAAEAAKYPLTNSEFVETAADAKEIITTRFAPLNICSNYGFSPKSKHPTWKIAGEPVWIYTRTTNWAHNVTVAGIVKVAGNWYVIIQNSWGMSAHKNGDFFVVTLEEFDRWVGNAECASVGEIDLSDNAPIWDEEIAA